MNESYYEYQKFENIQLQSETIADTRFSDCEFVNCTLEDCQLRRCTFSNCTFERCTIRNLKAERSQIQLTQWLGCRLVGVNWSELLPSGRFMEPFKELRDCRLKYNTFTEMNLKQFDFSGSEITDSMFADCQLTESNFRNCSLVRTEFFKCSLQKSDFRDAAGYQIDILSCQMKDACFSFPEAIHLLDILGIEIE